MADRDRDRWDEIYRDREQEWRHGCSDPLTRPGAFWDEIEELLPTAGRALDLAGGTGRYAVAMARRGLSVTVADISEVGLRLAEAAARDAGLTIATHPVDLDLGMPAGPWRLVFVHHFLDRDLIRSVTAELEPDGVFAICHPTRSNLQRHERPSARFLLEDGELQGLLEQAGLRIEWLREGWTAESRYEARALARAPGR